jgi:DinB superfamily
VRKTCQSIENPLGLAAFGDASQICEAWQSGHPGESRVSDSQEVRLLLLALDQAYDRKSWHGTNLRGSIRGVSPVDAARRPHPDRHNIWEIVVHAAYWKYVVWRRLTGQRRGSFLLKGSNWFRRPQDGTEREWRADVPLLDRMHRSLREAVDELSARAIWQTPKGSSVSNASIIAGAAAHDLYHAGQIQLLKRLQTRD